MTVKSGQGRTLLAAPVYLLSQKSEESMRKEGQIKLAHQVSGRVMLRSNNHEEAQPW